MMKKLLTLVLSGMILAPAAALACDGTHGKSLKTVDTSQGAKLSKEGKTTFVDANGQDTREKHGVIPGAVLLTSYEAYDVAKELPAKKDQALVFYCAGIRCGASKVAAERAVEAGYTNVAVLPEGITGWEQAGNPVQKIPAVASKPNQS